MVTFDGKYEYSMINEVNRLDNLRKEAIQKNNRELYEYVMESSKNTFKNHPLNITSEEWNLIDTQSKQLFCDLKIKECNLLGREKEKEYWINVENNVFRINKPSVEPVDPVLNNYIEEKIQEINKLDNEVNAIKQSSKTSYEALSNINYQYKEMIDEIERVITVKNMTETERTTLRNLIQEIQNKSKNIQPSQQELDATNISFG